MRFTRDITLGQYYPAQSVIHSLDPRTKLISLMILMVYMVSAVDLWLYAGFSIVLILTVVLARLPFGLVFRNIRPFLWLFFLTFGFNAFQSSGKILFQVPVVGWSVTTGGIERALVFTIRIALLILWAAVFTLTTSPMDITDALARLLKPLKKLKFPVQEFSLMMTIAIRFVPLLLEEAERIQKAQMARGARFEGNLVQRVKSLIPLIVPLFVSAFRKADELALAMEARGYRIGKERTSFRVLRFQQADYVAFVLVLLMAVPVLKWV
jgi:energy-coupling factor transport system permease protein